MKVQHTHKQSTISRTLAVLALATLCLGGFGSTLSFAVVSIGPSALGVFHPSLARPSVTTFASETCTTTALCPAGVTNAYGFASLFANSTMNGTGQAVVIIDACGDSAITTDAAKFDTTNGLSPINLTVYQPQGKPCSDPTGWGVETALDVEWAHVMAPGAAIHLVEAASSSSKNLFGAWNYSLANHLGLVISNSWGGNGVCPSNAQKLLTTATRAHTTILASAGDSGAWGSNMTLAAQQPADCAAVVAVGGTSLHLVSSTGGYSSEKAWSGSGGGYTPLTKEPTYQKTAKISDSFGEIAKPDVAAVADPSTGVWIFDAAAGGWFTVGGTSVACPIWAGFLADVNSWRAANAFGGLGSVNAFLYTTVYGVSGGSANYATTMHDITSGNNGWAAGTGWDAVTGIGSFRAYALANVLANAASA